ncbi:hypothetical protein RFI_14536, partial [Reticulomyxa filosa]
MDSRDTNETLTTTTTTTTTTTDMETCLLRCDEDPFCTHVIFVERVSGRIPVDDVIQTMLHQRRVQVPDADEHCVSQSANVTLLYYNLCLLAHSSNCQPRSIDHTLLQQLSSPFPLSSIPSSSSSSSLLFFNEVTDYLPKFVLAILVRLNSPLQQAFNLLSAWNGLCLYVHVYMCLF